VQLNIKILLQNLLKLYKSQKVSTPLEDFTTEVFSGILNLNTQIKKDFINNFLNIAGSNFVVETQKRYYLEEFGICIIDLVIENEKTLCFIENKVESKEGKNQLRKYSQILKNSKKENSYLFYCTKYIENLSSNSDKKILKFRWYEVVRFLNKYPQDPLLKDFNSFLKENKMAQDFKFNSNNFISIENFQDTLQLIKDYLELIKPNFKSHYKDLGKLNKGFSTTYILEQERLKYFYKNLINDNGWSEIRYGFYFANQTFEVSIYVDREKNQAYDKFVKEMKNFSTDFIVENLDYGTRISLEEKISKYLNVENSEQEIVNWYQNSFEKFDKLIMNTEEIDWNLKAPNIGYSK